MDHIAIFEVHIHLEPTTFAMESDLQFHTAIPQVSNRADLDQSLAAVLEFEAEQGGVIG